MPLDIIANFKHRFAVSCPLFSDKVQAGFPSPADDHLDKHLDLNELLIKHPAATFFCRVSGNSMVGLGIQDGCILVVDRALPAKHGDIVLAAVNGELTCKTLDTHRSRLLSSNPKFAPIKITEERRIKRTSINLILANPIADNCGDMA